MQEFELNLLSRVSLQLYCDLAGCPSQKDYLAECLTEGTISFYHYQKGFHFPYYTAQWALILGILNMECQ